MIPTTLHQFATACIGLDNNEIYELFEDQISDELAEEILDLNIGDDCPEPVRNALNKLGEMYNILSLINY